MHQNIDKVIQRGATLDMLSDKGDMLANHSERFRSSSRRLRRQMCWNDFKMKLAIGCAVVLLLYFLAASVCGMNFSKC